MEGVTTWRRSRGAAGGGGGRAVAAGAKAGRQVEAGGRPAQGQGRGDVPIAGAGVPPVPRRAGAIHELHGGRECPFDEASTQRLMLKGCEPQPRHRCRPRTPAEYVEPTPLSASLWAVPPDTGIVWDAYTCKSYAASRGAARPRTTTTARTALTSASGRRTARGSVRIGLDIGGGSRTFVARMREHGVMVVTTSVNFDGPFNNFIASRGLVPMHLSVASRLPFFDGTLNVVHSMHVLSSWIPDAMLESAFFDVFRVLRLGGVFWLDHFFCLGSQLDATYLPMFDRIGFKKLWWNAGKKLDRGIHMDEWYISALL
ncbi:S-adenosyl-L-methionine-dependent methyltransferase superfamily protein [Zea mays]|uniref:S-adenosyl-L-methionine-dependent methyltransferase superfamily protein n=1 Tax=Zea mays TaxID=4577 RepID=A0A1D6I2R0_MAIZE|nr:S-adenosyl-L-methionine-dependent methyltransferase superfamily protein [Zea mays]